MAPGNDSWRRLVRELAEADAPQVIEEARVAARARARAALEEALVEELLRTAARPVAASSPETNRSADPDTRPLGQAWWAYGVVPAQGAAELADGLSGVEPDAPVETVVEGDLAALLSRVPLAEYGDDQLRQHLEDIVWLEQTARAHEKVQETVMRRAPLVPLRLCTIYRDLDGVRRALRENAGLFAENLAAVQDCAEWGVKVFLSDRPADDESQAAVQDSSGTQYLASRQRERDLTTEVEELCLRCAQEVHDAVSEVAEENRVNPTQPPETHGRDGEMVLNAAFLVKDSRIAQLQSTVSELEDRWASQGLRVELTGPWPPYNFVSDSAGMIS